MIRSTSARLTCLACLAFAACGSDPPDALLVGAWGVDPVELDEELTDAARHGQMAKSMAEANAKKTLNMRMEFSRDGRVQVDEGPLRGSGDYEVAEVTPDTVTIEITGEGSLPPRLTFVVTDSDHLTMTDDSKAWSLRLVRR